MIKDEGLGELLTARTSGVLGHGANLAVRRGRLEAVGGYDERLGPGATFRAGEDVDLLDRFFAAGHTGWFEPAAHAWHEQWRSRRELLDVNWGYGIGAGARVAKLVRTDRPRSREVARAMFWDWGLANVARLLPTYRFAALTSVTRFVAATLGLARGLTVPVVHGHYAPA